MFIILERILHTGTCLGKSWKSEGAKGNLAAIQRRRPAGHTHLLGMRTLKGKMLLPELKGLEEKCSGPGIQTPGRKPWKAGARDAKKGEEPSRDVCWLTGT